MHPTPVSALSTTSRLHHPTASSATHQERDPQNLLAPLAATLAERQVSIQHALFVPPDSSYMKLGATGEAPNLSWQHALRAVWDTNTKSSSSGGGGSGTIGTAAIAAARAATAAVAAVPALPPLPAVAAPGAPAITAVAAGARSVVLPNLAVTLDWLRRCVREAPSLRMQVLVTGSLYMVGDLLKQLQAPSDSN